MSQDRVFSIVGDSNVQRFANQVTQRACPDIAKAHIFSCGKLQLLPDALKEIHPDTTACILSCVSNFLCDTTPGSSSASVRVDSAIEDFRKYLLAACSENPDVFYLVCPPMYRRSPLWYRDGLPEILKKFSSMMSSNRPNNLLLLPSFPNPDFDSDGVHLTPFSGLEFIFHLFDSSKKALEMSEKSADERLPTSCEAIRVLEDRMMANEQDHKRLNSSFEAKVAVDAELADFQENVRNEVFFVLSGLPRIPPEIQGRDWQKRAIAEVQEVIVRLLGKELPIVVVQNITGRSSDAPTRYHVRMEYAAHSQEIRSKFGSFFSGGVDRRPPELRNVSISNRITPATQVRIAIMKLMAKRYVDSNEGAKARVISYEARPMIKLVPPPGLPDSRVKNFTFIEAVRKLPFNFTPEDLKTVLARANRFAGKLRSLFVVLNDDMKIVRPASRSGGPGVTASEASESAESAAADASGGTDVESDSAAEGFQVVQSRKRKPDGPAGGAAKR